MKKLSAFIILIFAAIFAVSCGFADEDEDFTDTENSSADSNSDDSSNQENTQENNTGDTGSDSNQDSDPSDTTDSDSDSNNDQGGDNSNGDNNNTGTNPGDDTDTGTNPGDNTGTDDNSSGTTVEEEEEEEEEEEDYDYEKCTEITLDSKIEYNYWDLDFMMQGGTVYRAYYDPRTGSDPDKEDYLNFEFYNTGRYLTGSYDLAGKNYSSYSGLFLVVYEDGGAKNYIQRKGRVIVTSKEGASSSIIVKITDVFLEEVTIDKSTHATTVVTDGACLKINDATVSE